MDRAHYASDTQASDVIRVLPSRWARSEPNWPEADLLLPMPRNNPDDSGHLPPIRWRAGKPCLGKTDDT